MQEKSSCNKKKCAQRTEHSFLGKGMIEVQEFVYNIFTIYIIYILYI